MATAYKAPAGFDPPEIDYRADLPSGVPYKDSPLFRKEEAYLARLAAEAKRIAAAEGKEDPIIGEIVRFQRGDGYAQYMIWRARPLQLVHIETGDAWQVEDALIRGLRLSDVRAMVEADKRLEELFSRR